MADTIDPSAPLFTCLSCLIAFPTGEAQRDHYRSDHHRYNMKRRVASLPPVSAFTFNQKVLDKRAETALTTADRGATCEVCNKVYSTENAYRSHIISKKHRENELKAALSGLNPVSNAVSGEVPSAPEAAISANPSSSARAPSSKADAIQVDGEEDEASSDEDEQTLEEKLAAARSRMGPLACLFCSTKSNSVEENLEHMSASHSFFVPDATFIVDLSGLITYLAEKVAIGNACLNCNREFRTMHAVRKHMVDKSHCKIAYDKEREKLEISDFYDFTSSYPDAPEGSNAAAARRSKSGRKLLTAASAIADEDWEDDEDEDRVTVGDDESEYEVESEGFVEDDTLPNTNLSYGDTPYELVLPSGARIGHRSMAKYYKQSFTSPLPNKDSPTNAAGAPTGRELVRRILDGKKSSKDSALVPARGGGFGAFGNGTVTIKAKNAGEAREAGRHVREFRDQKKREHFKTAVGFRGNHQKHYRDPLLQ